MRRRLEVVGYYRLSGYWHHMKVSDDAFRSGADFEVVWQQYIFDRKLRLLTMDAVERIEVAIRSLVAQHHTKAHGPFGDSNDSTALSSLPVDPSRKPGSST